MKLKKLDKSTFAFPAGKCWVTDPCYAYPDEEWHGFCDVLWSGGTPNQENMFSYGRTKFFVWGTAYGDGIYTLNGPKEGQCGVDAGLLSIIPESLVKAWGAEAEMKRLEKGLIVVSIEMKRPFTIKCSGGNAEFGEYSIKTDGSDVPDDEDTPDDE